MPDDRIIIKNLLFETMEGAGKKGRTNRMTGQHDWIQLDIQQASHKTGSYGGVRYKRQWTPMTGTSIMSNVPKDMIMMMQNCHLQRLSLICPLKCKNMQHLICTAGDWEF